MEGGLHPAFGVPGSLFVCLVSCLGPKGRQMEWRGRGTSKQKQRKWKKLGKEVLFLEKVVLRKVGSGLLSG